MRSINAPRVAHDATVEIGEGHRARAINLSTGGIFIAAEEPLDLGDQVHLKVNLRDGAAPLDVEAQVLRRADGGMALRFVELDDVGKRRIQRLVQKREPTQFGKRDVRIHLPSLSAPLRASARDLTERGVMIEAELPWLRLGSQVTTELSADRACDGRVQWIGLDVTRSGSARLRIFVDLTEERADGTPVGPPPSVVAADDALPIVDAEPARRARRLALGMAVAGARRALRQRSAVGGAVAEAAGPDAVADGAARARCAGRARRRARPRCRVTRTRPLPRPLRTRRRRWRRATPAPSKPSKARKPARAKKHARITPRAG